MVPQPQPSEGVSYAPKIKKEQGHIDWSRPASLIERQLRAFTPWPGLFTALSGNPPLALKIWGAAIEPSSGPPGEVLAADKDGIVVGCGLGSLRILTLQREGRRRMGAAEFLAGTRIVPGSTLS
jgi:methionyl-tRNA formyltransferase